MGDLSPAPTILPTPLPAPSAVSNVIFWVGCSVGARFRAPERVSGLAELLGKGLGDDLSSTESAFNGPWSDRCCVVDSDVVGADGAGVLGVRSKVLESRPIDGEVPDRTKAESLSRLA